MAGSELMEAALDYARMGIAVHPLVPREKRPATANGFHDATTDEAQIRAGWGADPSFNIGGAMGEPSGGVVCIDIDLDDEKGTDGYEFLARWEREHGELPETARAITGRGGAHLFYRASCHVAPSANPDVGIDIRGDGSYAMLAPSVHPNGNSVQWEFHPDEYGIADADESVMAFIEAVRPKGFGAKSKFELPKEIRPGSRNRTLYELACSLQSHEYDDDLVWATVETANARLCKPPVGEDELRRIVKSALSLPKGHSPEVAAAEGAADGPRSGQGRPRGGGYSHAKVAENLIGAHGACILDGAPAIREGNRYLVGWDAVNAKIVADHPSSKRSQRAETCEYIRLRAPRVSMSDARYIAFENGVLDVETMEFWSHRDDLVIPNLVPHRWNPYAECAAVDEVLSRVSCGNPVAYLNLTEVMGLCLYRSARFPVAPILLGGGSNGKSTYIDMLKALVGPENRSALGLEEIAGRFTTAQLAGKLANLGDDIPADFATSATLSVFKKVTAGNEVYADVKGVAGFTFAPYCTLVFSANSMPRLERPTEGEMRRLFPIEFNARFSRDDDGYDPMVGEKVTSEEACEYMAQLAVEGLRRVIAQRGMTRNGESERRLDEIRKENDPVLQWMEDEELDRWWFYGRPTALVYQSYIDWCDESGVRIRLQRKSLTVRIRDMFGFRVDSKRVDGKTVKAFLDRDA